MKPLLATCRVHRPVRLLRVGLLTGAVLLFAPCPGLVRGLDEGDVIAGKRTGGSIDVFGHLADDLLEKQRVAVLGTIHGVLEHIAFRERAPVRTLLGFHLLEPLPGRIGSGFGPRLHPILGVTRIHRGVDVGAPAGTSVRAAGPGKVLRSGHAGTYGVLVTIDHGDGTETRYAHLSRTQVDPGESVVSGQVIGEAGSTGLSTGPHLHFELRVDGEPLNPAPWLPGLRGS